MFDLILQKEELFEPYRADQSDLCNIDILKKVLHGYHAAYFSCAIFQLSLKTMQHSSSGLQSAVTLPN